MIRILRHNFIWVNRSVTPLNGGEKKNKPKLNKLRRKLRIILRKISLKREKNRKYKEEGVERRYIIEWREKKREK